VSSIEDDLVTYEARATNLRFEMGLSGDCTATVSTIEANTDPNVSFLTVDYSATPALYSAGFSLNVTYTIACRGSSSQTFSNVPFPILLGFDGFGLLSNSDKTMTGTYEVPEETYSSTWTLNAVPRTNP
jgi:hypothetical protein